MNLPYPASLFPSEKFTSIAIFDGDAYVSTAHATGKAEVPRCRNCKFWSRETQWGVTDTCEKSTGERSQDGVWASYDDSEVHTGPDFGCVHFEPKE